MPNIILPAGSNEPVNIDVVPVPNPTPSPSPEPNPTPTPTPTSNPEPTPEPTPEPVDEIEIDGEVYKLDDKGNAITTDGNIFMEKSKIDELSDEPNDIAGINDIAKIVNIQPVDDKGTPIAYDNTVDGIAQYVNDVVNIRLQEASETIEREFFEQNPDIYNVYLHKLNTGSIEGFGNRVDWSTVNLESADDEVLSNMIIANEVRKGTSKDRADYLTKLIKADGKLKEQGAFAQIELLEADSLFESTALKARQEQEEADRQAANTYWANVENSINSGKLKIGDSTYKLPQVYRIKTADGKSTTANNQDFLEYLSKPKTYTIDGQQYSLTGDQLDTYLENQKKTHDDYIFEALKRFTKGDTSQFIQEQVKQEITKRIILSTKEGSKRGQSVDKGGTKTIKLPVH